MRVVVLGGGNSLEREVSLRSAAAVAGALKEAGYEVEQFDPKDGLEFLSGLSKDTIIFPILHGSEGEDGVIQKAMEDLSLCYLGSDSKSSRLCFDKGETRQMLVREGIAVAEGASVTKETYAANPLTKKPHVLKAQRGGSSIGTYLVHDPSHIDSAKVAEVFELDSKAILEELVEGTEITVPVLDGNALPVIEIIPPTDAEFDYENKYNGKTQELCPPVSINVKTQVDAQEIAEKVHRVLGCRHLSRIDMIVRKDSSVVVLEANTMPGMTNQSLYPGSAKVAGLPMPRLVERFVKLVKRDYKI